jgi:hypothetical protein
MSVPCRLGTPTYKPQVKTSHRACIHTLPCALRHRTSPPSWGGLWRYHVSYVSEPRVSAEVGSGATTCPMAPNLASWLRWALVLPRVLWLQASRLGRGGLRRCHVSYGSGPHLPGEVCFDAVMYPMALDHASRLRWAPALPRVPRLPVGHVPHA